MIENYYKILGINRNSSSDEIKSAYRKLAMKYHPDKNNGAKFYDNLFKKVQNAYEILSNSEKKAKYDRIYDEKFKNSEINLKVNNYYYQNTNKNTFDNEHQDNFDYKNYLINYKKTLSLEFEEKAWIFIGNFIFPLILGFVMFVIYRNDGFVKKSNDVIKITFYSIGAFILLIFIFAIFGSLSS